MGIVNNFFSKKSMFGVLMVISTVTLSLSAAYYSVFGLSSLFAGAKTEVMIMASALEFSKIIVASYLHNNWKSIGVLLRSYLTTGVIVLMLITSAGIYGFLTSAYQITSDQLTIIDKQTEVVSLKQSRFQEQIDGYRLEKEQLNKSISQLSAGLSNNVITSIKMESLTDSITKLDLRILDMESNNEVAAEVGPLRYLSKITGKPMDVIVNWFTLLIVFVFDPLAIAMVIAINKYINGNPIKVEEVTTEYSKNDVKVIMDTIENSPVPNEPLKKAAETYKRVIKQKSEPPTDVESTKEADSKTFYGEELSKRKYNDSVKSSEGKLK